MLTEADDTIKKVISERIRLAPVHEEKITHYPSEMMSCLRSRYYSWTGVQENQGKPNGEWLKRQFVFALGNAVEEHLGKMLSMAGLLPSLDRAQVRIRSREHLISGSIDFLIRHDGKDIPIECKSAKHEAFKSQEGYYCTNCGEKLRKNAVTCKGCNMHRPEMEHKVARVGYDTDPSDDHYAQLQCYLHIGGYEYGYIYYLDKNTCEDAWFKVEKDDEFWTGVLVQNAILNEMLESHTVPERPYSATFDLNGDMKMSSDWQCRYCRYSDYCYREEITDRRKEREAETFRLFNQAGGT